MSIFQVCTLGRMCLWFLLIIGLLSQSQQGAAHFYKIQPGTFKEFQYINCQGTYNRSTYTKLIRICEECQNLYRNDYTVSLECKENCFQNEMFDKCVLSLLLAHKEEEYKNMITYASG
ncbi:crustacean hyperglycemic hormone isoform X1 [Cherax quadricarinatus]|uniref:Iron transport protein n=3 Tax=Cherax quadricarinatus TaxID=27406 RepID=A0A2U8JAH0_CHEQU|nr:crustacean hyperglycemic hormone-like [Cherax quadricarinatus]AWK57528.1 iron transport protein [Cherax quadricarinatus]